MKYVKQLLIILSISLVGELLNYFLPLPIPTSIYGMLLLFILLMTGVLKLEAVRDVGVFLIEIMPIMFIPASVGLMTSWGLLQPMILQIIVITVVTLLLVMILSGRITQYVITHDKSKTNQGVKEEVPNE